MDVKPKKAWNAWPTGFWKVDHFLRNAFIKVLILLILDFHFQELAAFQNRLEFCLKLNQSKFCRQASEIAQNALTENMRDVLHLQKQEMRTPNWYIHLFFSFTKHEGRINDSK